MGPSVPGKCRIPSPLQALPALKDIFFLYTLPQEPVKTARARAPGVSSQRLPAGQVCPWESRLGCWNILVISPSPWRAAAQTQQSPHPHQEDRSRQLRGTHPPSVPRCHPSHPLAKPSKADVLGVNEGIPGVLAHPTCPPHIKGELGLPWLPGLGH